MRVGVMGAGAVGCYVGGRLAGARGTDVVLVGRQRLADAVAAGGLTLAELDGSATVVPAGALQVATEPAALADCDVVLVCVKSRHTAEVAETLAGIVRKDAVVVSLQNGVGNPAELREKLPGRVVLAGIVGFNVVPRGPASFRQSTLGALMIEASGDARAQALIAALAERGVEVESHPDIERHQWTKLLLNLNNAVSALSGAPTSELALNAGYRRVVAAIMREGLGVLKAAGIQPARMRGLPIGLLVRMLSAPTPIVKLLARAQLRADPSARSSMYEDLIRGRPTEVDYLNGEIVRLAAKHGVPAPLNTRVVELIRDAEKAGAGSPKMTPGDLWQQLTADRAEPATR